MNMIRLYLYDAIKMIDISLWKNYRNALGQFAWYVCIILMTMPQSLILLIFAISYCIRKLNSVCFNIASIKQMSEIW